MRLVGMVTNITIETIAALCHNLNKAVCEAAGDFSQKSWSDAEEWQRQSTISGVNFRLSNPDAKPGAQHEAWCSDKLAAGWKFGAVKDAGKKEHPCLVPFSQLPFDQQVKDHVFIAAVDSLKGAL